MYILIMFVRGFLFNDPNKPVEIHNKPVEIMYKNSCNFSYNQKITNFDRISIEKRGIRNDGS